MRRAVTRWLAALLFMVTALLYGSVPMLGIEAAQTRTSRYFPETGHTVKGRFLDYWTLHGGLPQQGYPISDEMSEVSDRDGKTYTVQYFERAVFEKHPENAPPNDVLLSLLGVSFYQQKYPDGAPGQKPSTEANAHLFTQTGHKVGGPFLAYWQTHGGLAQQGYPISDAFYELSTLNGQYYKVQYFERAVFEYHPENAAPYNVLLSQLGTYRLSFRYGGVISAPPPGATPTAAPVPGGPYQATASVDKPAPAHYSDVTVTGHLTQGVGNGVGGVPMRTTWHYQANTSYCEGVTDGRGVATCTMNIDLATYDYEVIIDVLFVLPDGGTVYAQTYFTPSSLSERSGGARAVGGGGWRGRGRRSADGPP